MEAADEVSGREESMGVKIGICGIVAGGRGSSDRERRRWSRTQVDWENLVGQVSG